MQRLLWIFALPAALAAAAAPPQDAPGHYLVRIERACADHFSAITGLHVVVEE